MTSIQDPPVNDLKLNRLQRLNVFLDEHVLLYPVKFLTNRIVILTTLALLIPLIVFSNNQVFVNALNSYLNVTSVAVGSTVLLYATIADIRDRAAAKHADDLTKTYEELLESRIQGREDLAKTYEELLESRLQGREDLAKNYEQVLEKRVKADHELIEQILQNTIENVLGGPLEKIQLEDSHRLEEMQKAVLSDNALLHKEIGELRELVLALRQNDPGKSNPS
jgi:hypothetical protein